MHASFLASTQVRSFHIVRAPSTPYFGIGGLVPQLEPLSKEHRAHHDSHMRGIGALLAIAKEGLEFFS